MKAEIEVITPAYAKQLLEQNPGNRRLMKRTIDRYAGDMKAGFWVNNGQGLVIDEAGDLMDGQHRCAAIIAAQMSIAMVVVRGVPRERFTTLDAGKPRSFRDVLHIRGTPSATQAAAACRSMVAYLTTGNVNHSVTRSAMDSFFLAHPYLEQIATEVTRHKRAGTASILGPQMIAVLFLANESRKLDAEVAAFIDGTASGAGLFSGDARLTLRNWYGRARTATGHLSSPLLFTAIARTWSAFGRGDSLSVLRFPPILGTRETTPIYGLSKRLYADLTVADPPLPPQRTNLPKALATPTVSEVLGAP